ncbi:hypothetical protein ACQY0O_007198 [Thecaphora frezii]
MATHPFPLCLFSHFHHPRSTIPLLSHHLFKMSPKPTPPSPSMHRDSTAALSSYATLSIPGFESSKVFALSASLLSHPAPGMPSRRRLVRTLQSVYLFIIHPSQPLDPSNPRTKPKVGKVETSGGALKPALWYVDFKSKGTIGLGHPPKGVLGRKTKPDVVVECKDRDFVDVATGKVQAQKLYNEGRIKVRGNLDKALKIASVLSHQRNQIYQPPAPKPTAAQESGSERNDIPNYDYADGSPAPVPNRAKL